MDHAGSNRDLEGGQVWPGRVSKSIGAFGDVARRHGGIILSYGLIGKRGSWDLAN